jgi:hypothetical protein
MIENTPHPDAPQLKWQYVYKGMTGWARTREEAAIALTELDKRTPEEDKNYQWKAKPMK